LTVSGDEVLIEGSTMVIEAPANQPSQTGDIVTHATKNVSVMTTGSVCFTVDNKAVCGTADIAALNVITKESHLAQVQMPLLGQADFDIARQSNAAAATMNEEYLRAFPPARADATKAGHPVDLGTGCVIDDAVDLSLPGYFPLVWARFYCSAARSRRGALGKGGWTHCFEQRLEVTERGFYFHNEEGRPLALGPIVPGGCSFHRGERLELRAVGSGYEIRSLRDRRVRVFKEIAGGRLALREIRDAYGHRIALDYEGGVLVRLVDTVGREVRLQNDARGRITRVEVWAAEPGKEGPRTLATWFDYTYHPEGELASHTDALGHAEGWDYDGLHRMVRATLRNGVSFHYEYHPELGYCARTWGDNGLHDVRIEVDFKKGETRTFGTNRARRYFWKDGLVRREETYDHAWATERIYDDDKILVATRNGAGEAFVHDYDERGNLVSVTDPAGNVSQWTIEDDLPVRLLEPDGLVTTYAYDGRGAPVAITFPAGASYQLERDRDGRLVGVHGATGALLRRVYDDHNNVAAETSGRGATTTYRHDSLGRPLERTDALGRRSRIRYDAAGRIVESCGADGTILHLSHDELGNLARVTDALGRVTAVEHAGTGRPARIVQADGQVTCLRYDSDERLVEILNPRLESYRLGYDRADQVVSERTFDGRLVTYRHSAAGRVVRIDYPEQEWRELQYDKLGNITEDRGSDVQITFQRDAQGRVEKATSEDVMGKVVTELERDRFGRLTADIQDGRAVRYEYDAAGRTTARVLPDGERTEYHYDVAGAFAGVTHDGERLFVERDAVGRERRRRMAGWSMDTEYDAMDGVLTQKVLGLERGSAGPELLAGRRYGHDTMGRVTSIESSQGGVTTYHYSEVDQLLEATRGAVHEVFDLDPAGSLVHVLSGLEVAGSTGQWAIAPGNRLKATHHARYVDDDRGRRIQRVERTDGSVTTYGWDTRDRLREVVRSDGTRVRFSYDAFGRRARKDVLGPVDAAAVITRPAAPIARRTVTFVWDGDVLCEEVDSSKPEAARKRVHVHAPGTFAPILQVEAGSTLGVLSDHLGMPKELVDEAGRVAWRAEHGAWGDVRSASRDPGAPDVQSPFRLLGQYADEETDLCATRFRYFESSTGRWLSPDPLGFRGGPNLYAFDGSPTLVADPLGLCAPKDGDPGKAFLDRALALQRLDAPPAGFKQKWSENGRDFEARVHPADAAHGKTGSIFRVGRKDSPDPNNPKAQGTGTSMVDAAGTWHPEPTLKETSKTGVPNPTYNPTAAKDTHIQI
jgi:RHS repeat-associated protein